VEVLDRSDYELVVDERFTGDALDAQLWFPYHLPHWSSRALAGARYRLRNPGLELLIEADQRPWYVEGDGYTRLSTLQTGEFGGPLGSEIGQHRFKPDLFVREEQARVALLVQQYGLFECRASAIADPANMVALWMIGFEDVPQHSAEICVFEIFGNDIADGSARVGVGVHPHGDPRIRDDFTRESVTIDATQPHDYAALWTPHGVSFFVDEQLIKYVDQSPDYPVQLMLSIFEFVDGPELASPLADYPKVFRVEWIRVWRDTGLTQRHEPTGGRDG
jgi:hypothetical protein